MSDDNDKKISIKFSAPELATMREYLINNEATKTAQLANMGAYNLQMIGVIEEALERLSGKDGKKTEDQED